MIDVIHIGDYKTGSSWLQRCLFKHHPDILYIDNPEEFPYVARLFNELVDVADIHFDEVSFRERFSLCLSQSEAAHRQLLVSRESLFGDFITSNNAERTARRLKNVFHQSQVIIVIREQLSMLSSIYSEYIKCGGTLKFSKFIWDPIVSKGLLNRLNYSAVIETYKAYFGEENVLVKIYDDFICDKVDFSNDILKFIDCKEMKTEEFDSLDYQIVNPSLRSFGLSLHRWLNHLIRTRYNPSASIIAWEYLAKKCISDVKLEALVDRYMVHVPKVYEHKYHGAYLDYALHQSANRYISKLCEKFNFGSKILISEHDRKEIISYFVADNNKLIKEHSLDIASYGWIC